MRNDEAVRRLLAARSDTRENGSDVGARELVELTRAEALAFLGSVGFGRIVFTRGGLPAIRPVNHALVDGQLVIRTHEGAALTKAAGAEGVVVAYEADMIDPVTHLGWSVVVTGFARLVSDPQRLERYERLLQPWISERLEQAVTIQLDEVTGFWLTRGEQGAGPGSGPAPRG